MSKLHKIVATTAFVGTVAVGGSQIADADTYTIKSGDTLWDIAVNNGTTVDALMQDNNLSSHLIYPGDKLNYSSSSSSSVEKLAQVKNDGYYTIALGDTLGTVADKFGTSVDNLVEINNLSNPHLVYVGQVIKVDGNAAPKATPAVAQAAPVQAAPVQAAPVQAAPVARVQAAPVAQTRVAAPAAQTKAAAPVAQTKAAAPAAQTKAAAPAAQTKVAAPAAQTKAAAPAAQTKAAAPAAQTKAAAPVAQTKAAAPAAQTKAAAPVAETKAAAPAAQTKAAAPATQTKAVTTTAPKTETKAAAQTPAPAAQTKAATPAPKAETKAATQTPAPAAQTKAATPAPAAQTKPAATTPSGSKNAAIYQAALAQVGRYQDCTMLVTNALKSVGINYHDWPAGYMKLGTQVSASQAQAGDLVYYANGGTGLAHIAVYAGNGQAVHGGWLGNQTVVNSANVGSGPVYIRVK